KQCLGIIKCSEREAQTRPQIKEHGKRSNDRTLEWKKCSAKCKFISLNMPDENGYFYYLLHIGHHEFQHCIQNKPFNNEKEQLQKCVHPAPETLP
ncbi:5489_t:CDS:2, partial [Entrophospora sp. SA101]